MDKGWTKSQNMYHVFTTKFHCKESDALLKSSRISISGTGLLSMFHRLTKSKKKKNLVSSPIERFV